MSIFLYIVGIFYRYSIKYLVVEPEMKRKAFVTPLTRAPLVVGTQGAGVQSCKSACSLASSRVSVHAKQEKSSEVFTKASGLGDCWWAADRSRLELVRAGRQGIQYTDNRLQISRHSRMVGRYR